MSTQSEYTLFQRIKLGQEGATKQLSLDPYKLRLSIQHHLQNMFNTRQGSTMANLDYGLPDFNDLDMSNGFTLAVAEIKTAIVLHLQNYEPRLVKQSIRVNHIEDTDEPLGLQFEISARLNLEGYSGRVRFEASLLNEGSVKVTT